MCAWPTTQLLKCVTLLDAGQRLDRALDADDQVPDRAGHDEPPRRVAPAALPAAPARRQPQVRQHGDHRNDHRHGVHDATSS